MSLQGKDFTRRSRETESRLPPHGEKVTRSMSFTTQNDFFFYQQKFKEEQSFSMGSSVGLTTDREARKLCAATGASEATKLSGARTREQRWAGQLVSYTGIIGNAEAFPILCVSDFCE